MTRPLLLLIDGTGLLVRSSRAGRRSGMNDGSQSTATLTLWLRSAARLLRVHEPTHALVCFDGIGARMRRCQVYPAYKAHRYDGPSTVGIDQQLIEEFCAAAGLACVARNTWEADDQIAWAVLVAARWEKPAEVIIASDDHDLHQLVGPWVTQVLMSGNSGRPWDVQRVLQHYGVSPHQLPAYWALVGDRSDNIPGVAGIGPVRARQLLANGQTSLSEAIASMPVPVRFEAELYESLMNLRLSGMELDRVTEMDPGSLSRIVQWSPVVSDDVLRFMDVHRMTETRRQLVEGRLWPTRA